MSCQSFSKGVRHEADQLFEQWMEQTGSKQCPTCRMAVSPPCAKDLVASMAAVAAEKWKKPDKDG